MATCRLQNLKPPCGYNLEGIETIQVLDYDDFGGFKFDGDDLYNNCTVTGFYKVGTFNELEAPEGSKYSSSITNKIYTHILETFIPDLSGVFASSLHLGTKRRYVPLFQLKNGKYYTFGYEAGATITYTNQTADSIGSLVTITASSIYPLFEVQPDALTNDYSIDFIPDFSLGAYCEVI